MSALAPVRLGPNYARQSYPGGGRSARFRGIDPAAASSPEDWIASVTSRWQQEPEGMTRLDDGRLLRDAIEADPESYLGPEHLAAYGSDPGLLVKLLDSSERLVVHCHPDRGFARSHLGCAHGKTEAWLVLEAREGAEVYLAFHREVERKELEGWVAEQAVGSMLEAMHRVPVAAGSALLVPAGLPHAIGDGVLVLELQEPTDLSVMLEQGSFTGGDLGLGFEVALGCVDREAWLPERVRRLSGPGLAAEGALLPAAAEPFFRAERVLASSGGLIAAGYGVLVVRSGSGELRGDFPGASLALERGATVLTPWSAGPLRASGDLELIACRPPRPDSPAPTRPEV